MTAEQFASDSLMQARIDCARSKISVAQYCEVLRAYERVLDTSLRGWTVPREYPESYEDLACAALLALG